MSSFQHHFENDADRLALIIHIETSPTWNDFAKTRCGSAATLTHKAQPSTEAQMCKLAREKAAVLNAIESRS